MARVVAVVVELLLVPDCLHAATARTVLAESIAALGLDLTVTERVGDYPSPTILVDGVDVMTGTAGPPPLAACRLDVPTTARVLAALRNGRGLATLEETA
jgi:hypothetical protein